MELRGKMHARLMAGELTGTRSKLAEIARKRGVPATVHLSELERKAYEILCNGGSIPCRSVSADAMCRAAFVAGKEHNGMSDYQSGWQVVIDAGKIQLWAGYGRTVGGAYIRELIAEREVA